MKLKTTDSQLQFHFGRFLLAVHHPTIEFNVGAEYSDGSPKPDGVGIWFPTSVGWRGKQWAWDWAVFGMLLGFGFGVAWNHIDGREEEVPRGTL